jgi:hypothetical protein
MRLTIESTSELAHVNGTPVRVWTGKTERGTPALAFITRLAFDGDAPADELAELGMALVEPPTRIAEAGKEPVIVNPRACTVCNRRGRLGRPAAFVATGPVEPPLDIAGLGLGAFPPGMGNRSQWFECGDHGPIDNVAGVERQSLEPITAWFDRHALPLPGDDGGTLRAQLNAAVVATMAAGELVLVPTGKVAELASECRSLRERLADAHRQLGQHEPHWLVKDFHALYRAAETVINIETLAAARGAREFLRAQLTRLKPAFLACEGERKHAGGQVPS